MALDVVSLMMSAHLYTLCHALDLRAMNDRFMVELRPAIKELTARIFEGYLGKVQMTTLQYTIYSSLLQHLAITTTMDSSTRFASVARSSQHHLVEALRSAGRLPQTLIDSPLSLIMSWTDEAAGIAQSVFRSTRDKYLANPDATEYLGAASKRMYCFVRNELKVPMHRGLIDHPTLTSDAASASKKNTGTQISIIYKSLREEKLVVPIMECLKEAIEINDERLVNVAKL